MIVKRNDFDLYLKWLFKPELFSDFSPNGLQVEGKDTIKKIVFSVTASKEAIDFAVKNNADALIAHHGLIWKGTDFRTYTGAFAKRLFPLIKNDINLFAYHLPLDAHPEIGNNFSIAYKLSLQDIRQFAEYKGNPIGFMGSLPEPISVLEFGKKLEKFFNRKPIISTYDENAKIKTVGIISGGAGSDWYQAAKLGLDSYITGEINEHTWHDASESGVHLFACGHHATERVGVLALMHRIQSDFKEAQLECLFVDSNNPI